MWQISAAASRNAFGLLLVCLIGCHHGLNVNTNSVVEVASPIRGTFGITAASPSSEGPVVEMALDGRPCPRDGVKIALIDVDGLMLNQNLNSTIIAGDNPVALFREKLDAARSDPAVRDRCRSHRGSSHVHHGRHRRHLE
ncbi:MAG: hypothetical protein K8T89_01425 [Planctomycetes bacterium]|nr:hypothetical protein [Planctomycetota bacterium]